MCRKQPALETSDPLRVPVYWAGCVIIVLQGVQNDIRNEARNEIRNEIPIRRRRRLPTIRFGVFTHAEITTDARSIYHSYYGNTKKSKTQNFERLVCDVKYSGPLFAAPRTPISFSAPCTV